MAPLVAIVGRPNVGKSTLFNRLAGMKKAIVEGLPGVTRDLNYIEVNRWDKPFLLVDTGGFEPIAKEGILAQMAEQCRLALDAADVIILLLDGKEGVTPSDHEIAHLLRQRAKKVLYVINKIDDLSHDQRTYEFFTLGVDTLYPISAQHNRGIDTLADALVETLPSPTVQEESAEQALRIAVVGRPNVGKSSIINGLLGYERAIVHDAPGTTTDSIDTPFNIGDRTYVLVDTAGIRRKSRIGLQLEKYSVIEAIKSIERADVVMIIVDARDGITEQDARIGGMVYDRGKGTLLVINKWDLFEGTTTRDKFEQGLRSQVPFLEYAPVIFTSAITGAGLPRLLAAADSVAESRETRISTGRLNRWLLEISAHHSPPLYRKRRVSLSYMTQVSTRPPTFVIFTNFPTGVTDAYRRYMVNQLRDRFGFRGTPVRLLFRKKK